VVTADSVDGAALSAFQYFENVRNFLVAAQDIGLPCFEASDLEQVRPVSVAASPRPQGLARLLACCSSKVLTTGHLCFKRTLSRGRGRGRGAVTLMRLFFPPF
jgi:hypothetical protein